MLQILINKISNLYSKNNSYCAKLIFLIIKINKMWLKEDSYDKLLYFRVVEEYAV